MRIAALLAAASFLLTFGALAQSPPTTPAPPPPGINDPGVKATTPPVAKSRPEQAPVASGRPLNLKPQALPAMGDEGGARATDDQSPPEVRIRQEGESSIQEYSRSGRVYMVVITPKSGIQQIYMVDPEGRLVDEHGKKPVRPVMYKVLEWGKSRPPATQSNHPEADRGGN